MQEVTDFADNVIRSSLILYHDRSESKVCAINCMHAWSQRISVPHACLLIVILCLFCNLADYQGLHSWQHSPTQPGYVGLVQGQLLIAYAHQTELT